MISKSGYIESPIDSRDFIFGAPTGFDLPNECNYYDMIPKIKNQGSTMKCVPYSISYILELQDKLNGNDINVDIDAIYNARSNSSEGMCIREALKHIKNVGYCNKKILSYGRLGSVMAIKYSLLMNGPCVMGLPVYSNNTDFWNGSDYQGGHAIACIGYDEDSFILLNSWGGGFGIKGCSYLPFNDIDKVIECWAIVS